MTPEIIHSSNFVNDAVSLVEREADIAIFERGEFHLGLSGGNTPRPVFQELARRRDAWHEWIFTFGDERCVPPESDQSNYRMAKGALFDNAPIPPENILRIRGKPILCWRRRNTKTSSADARAGTGHIVTIFSFSAWARMAIRLRSFRELKP